MTKIKVEIDGMICEADEELWNKFEEERRKIDKLRAIISDFAGCLSRAHGNLEVELDSNTYSDAWVLYFKAGHVHIKFNNEIIMPEALYFPGLDEVAKKHNLTLMLADGNNSTYSIN